MAINSALYLLERAGHIERTSVPNRTESGQKRSRTILLLDDPPVTQLRVNFQDVTRRGDLERRKLREMIEFCYTDRCFRAYILDYFGDRHHARSCGTCGNCGHVSTIAPEAPAIDAPETSLRELTDDELLRVRKILACAKRMKGRFGKNILAATLRGSASKNVLQANLNQLSTYGLLKDMLHDNIMRLIDALIAARCLSLTRGQYPTVSITELGNRVMLEQERVELTLPPVLSDLSDNRSESDQPNQTMLVTFSLYKEGLNVYEIANRRALTTNTIEEHLQKCLSAGLEVDVERFVLLHDRVMIERAIEQHGSDKLKPLRDALPDTITYSMIRFVIADQQRRNRE